MFIGENGFVHGPLHSTHSATFDKVTRMIGVWKKRVAYNIVPKVFAYVYAISYSLSTHSRKIISTRKKILHREKRVRTFHDANAQRNAKEMRKCRRKKRKNKQQRRTNERTRESFLYNEKKHASCWALMAGILQQQYQKMPWCIKQFIYSTYTYLSRPSCCCRCCE